MTRETQTGDDMFFTMKENPMYSCTMYRNCTPFRDIYAV